MEGALWVQHIEKFLVNEAREFMEKQPQRMSKILNNCMQELQCDQNLLKLLWKIRGRIIVPSLEDIIKMLMETLGLTSAQEILMESIALEKERRKAELEKNLNSFG